MRSDPSAAALLVSVLSDMWDNSSQWSLAEWFKLHWLFVVLFVVLGLVLAAAPRPFKLHWLVVLLSAAVIPCLTSQNPIKARRGEWYPFSTFPMYANFEPAAYYAYITDLQDQPVATFQTFGMTPSEVKKAYDALLKDTARRLKKPSKKLTAEECRPAAVQVLEQICQGSKFPGEVRKHSGYRLYVMDLWLDDGRIVQKPKCAGEIP